MAQQTNGVLQEQVASDDAQRPEKRAVTDEDETRLRVVPQDRRDRFHEDIGPVPLIQVADVWLVRYDPRIVQVPIKRGENGGKTLPHRNVVRQLVRLGAWDGRPAQLRIPASADAALSSAILVQAPKGGPILAAIKAQVSLIFDLRESQPLFQLLF